MNYKLVLTRRAYKPIRLNFKSPLPSFPSFPAHLLILKMDSTSDQNFYNEHDSLQLPNGFNESRSNTPAYSGVVGMPGSQRGPRSVDAFSNTRRSWSGSGPMTSSDDASWGSSPMGSSLLPHHMHQSWRMDVYSELEDAKRHILLLETQLKTMTYVMNPYPVYCLTWQPATRSRLLSALCPHSCMLQTLSARICQPRHLPWSNRATPTSPRWSLHRLWRRCLKQTIPPSGSGRNLTGKITERPEMGFPTLIQSVPVRTWRTVRVNLLMLTVPHTFEMLRTKLWFLLRERKIHPTTWGEVTAEADGIYKRGMAAFLIEMRLCKDNWKATYVPCDSELPVVVQ